MSKQPSDSFLPSGAVGSPPTFSPGSLISPTSVIPRTVPEFSLQSQSSNSSPNQRPYLHSSRSPSSQGRPISPPKTRSASADDNTAALVEDWRAYTSKLRSHSEGERAHMAADRARMEEVMAEERALWDKEREILKARIVELELELERRGPGGALNSPPIAQRERISSQSQAPPQHTLSITSPGSNAISVSGSIDGSSSRAVPQESGRNADGSPFYAPAPRNPSRTFEHSELANLRVDTISAIRESPIRVTSKELTPSDFGVHSLPTSVSELETIPENLPESIDISHIQPELEGVPIRASAVDPVFAAKVLSPENHTPAKLSPNIHPPAREVRETLSPQTRDDVSPRSRDSNGKIEKVDVGALIVQPENRRLTMHAGHTPNHSITKLTDLLAGSGSATPTRPNTALKAHIHRPSCANFDGQDEAVDEDKELSGPLGLTNDALKDDPFLAQLVEKLEEAKRSEGVSPCSESASSLKSDIEDVIAKKLEDEEDKDLPPLRIKSSMNFGRPMGSM